MKKLWFSILMVLGLSGQSFAQYVDQIDIPFTRYELDNGLTLLVHEDHKAPIVAVNVWYHVGSKDEQPGKTGFAHLFEHLMFNGTENYNDEWFRPLEAAGATDRNGTTSFDRTNYFQNVPTPALDMVLWMESDRMGHLLGAIDQGKLDEQKGVVMNELRQNYANTPYGGAWDVILEGLFPEGHPYSWPSIGIEEDIEAASLEDVKRWFETYYGPDNAVLTIAGDVNPEEVLEKVEHYFGDIPAGPAITRPNVWGVERSESRRDVMQDDVPQPRLNKTWNTPPMSDPESVILEVAAAVLADGRNSRLYKRLVYDDQIATSVNGGQYGLEIASIFELEVYIKPGVDIAQVEQALNEELERFLEDGPTRDELERVKASYFAGVIRGLEQIGGTRGKAQVLATYEVLTGDAANFREDLRIYEEATPRQVRDVARKWLTDGDYTLEIHPRPAYQVSAAGADRSQIPSPGDAPVVNFPEAQRFVLDNGMPVILATYGSLPVVEMSMVFQAGYAADQGGKLGAAAMTSAMLQEGAGNLDSLEISDRKERLGAQISARSTLDTTVVSLSALEANLDDSVDLYADIIRRPDFPANELERVRGNWMDRIAQEKSDPWSVALRNLPPLLYGDSHPYGIPLTGSGTEASVQAMQREDLQSFHDTWMQPDNATLVVVGDISREELEPVLTRYFGSWQASDVNRPTIDLSIDHNISGGTIYLLDRPGSTQSLISGGQLLPPAQSEDTELLEMGLRILGGTFVSRLNMNLREDKGWAYGAQAIAANGVGERPLIYYAPVQSDKTLESLQEIIRETTEFSSSNPATVEEMERSREGVLRSFPGNYETAYDVLSAYENVVRYGRALDYMDQRQEVLRGMTVEQVRDTVSETFDLAQSIWLIVGDVDQIEQPLREANLGEVIVLEP